MTVLLNHQSRRRPTAPDVSIDNVVNALKACSLRKAATFHCSQSSLEDPLSSTFPSSLTRSATCNKALEALVKLTDEPLRPKKSRPTAARRIDCSDTVSDAPQAPTVTLSTANAKCSLSDLARQRLETYLFRPLLAQNTFEALHPLLEDLASEALCGRISSLRAAEREIIFLAPHFASSATQYRAFCETLIQRLHHTATKIHQSDQCAVGDRPYTPSYFADLANHIRRYAAILLVHEKHKVERASGMSPPCRSSATARAVDKPCTTRSTMMSTKMTPVPLNPELADAPTVPAKRGHEQESEGGRRRSIVRRKAGAPTLTFHCPEPTCRKPFNRLCDLTKHGKTHNRPAKCPELDCKYHVLGWPTDKECQRHWNDKHSPNPTVFRCLFDNCPYASKRESNCKQHMEKTHTGFVYIRAKGNGKTKRAMPLVPSNLSVLATEPNHGPMNPITSASAVTISPLTPLTAADDDAVQPVGPAPVFDQGTFDFGVDFNEHFDTVNFNHFQTMPITPAMSDACQFQFDADGSRWIGDSLDTSAGLAGPTSQTYAQSQMPTPADSLFNHFPDQQCDGLDDLDNDFPYVPSYAQATVPDLLSPCYTSYAPNLVLTPTGYDDYNDFTTSAIEDEDFQLFASASGGTATGIDNMETSLFPSAGPSRMAADDIKSPSGHITSSQSTNSQIFELFPDLDRPGST